MVYITYIGQDIVKENILFLQSHRLRQINTIQRAVSKQVSDHDYFSRHKFFQFIFIEVLCQPP